MRRGQKNKINQKSGKREWLEAFFFAFVCVIILFFVFWPYKIEGASMENTFFSGDRIIMSRVLAYFNKINYGDVVICKLDFGNTNESDTNKIVKRLIGLPKDHVQVTDGSVFVNGNKIEEHYLKESYTEGEVDMVLSESQYFVLGDNRYVSLDSRDMGAISKDHLIGKVIFRWFPIKFFQ